MSTHNAQWLADLPADAPLTLDGESAYLTVAEDGAELGVYLLSGATDAQLEDAARTGFQSARQFDAGLALREDGSTLVLCQWLPDVASWEDAAGALEQLLNQLAMWRAALAPSRPRHDGAADPSEQRIRALFAAGAR